MMSSWRSRDQAHPPGAHATRLTHLALTRPGSPLVVRGGIAPASDDVSDRHASVTPPDQTTSPCGSRTHLAGLKDRRPHRKPNGPSGSGGARTLVSSFSGWRYAVSATDPTKKARRLTRRLASDFVEGYSSVIPGNEARVAGSHGTGSEPLHQTNYPCQASSLPRLFVGGCYSSASHSLRRERYARVRGPCKKNVIPGPAAHRRAPARP